MRWKVLAFILLAGFCVSSAFSQNDKWLPNDMGRPMPGTITPAAQLGGPPSDAIVLFNGTNMDAWVGRDGNAPKWLVKDGILEVVPGTGSISTKQSFGDCQFHLEWREPSPATGDGQNKGNSGIQFMGLYEVQILDGVNNKTYADGIAGAVYGQYPPLVVAVRNPGEWQTYDILFRRARFDANGYLISPARITILQNGVYVQDNVALTGPTGEPRSPYIMGPESLPLMLQDHNAPVRFRNVWIRPLPAREADLHYTVMVPFPSFDPKDLASYVGHYQVNANSSIDLQANGNTLTAQVHGGGGRGGRGGRGAAAGAAGQAATPVAAPAPAFQAPPMILTPVSKDVFINAHIQGSLLITFTRDSSGQVTGLTMAQGLAYHHADKVQ
jgi:hypothetical protein